MQKKDVREISYENNGSENKVVHLRYVMKPQSVEKY